MADRLEACYEAYLGGRPEPPWGYFECPAAILCMPPKTGSTSLRTALLPSRAHSHAFSQVFYRHAQEIQIGPLASGAAIAKGIEIKKPVLLGFRDPLDRFGALWRDCQLSPFGTRFSPLHDLSMPELVDLIEQYPNDHHWAPQRQYWLPGIALVHNHEALPAAGLEQQWRRRRSHIPTPMTADVANRVRRHYAGDYELASTARWV